MKGRPQNESREGGTGEPCAGGPARWVVGEGLRGTGAREQGPEKPSGTGCHRVSVSRPPLPLKFNFPCYLSSSTEVPKFLRWPLKSLFRVSGGFSEQRCLWPL